MQAKGGEIYRLNRYELTMRSGASAANPTILFRIVVLNLQRCVQPWKARMRPDEVDSILTLGEAWI